MAAEFEGEVALVTGAASGIGAACVRTLLGRGAAVCGIDRSESVLTASESASYHGVICDVAVEESSKAAVQQCVERFGGVDILVLCAGVFPPSRSIDELSLAEWREVFAVNTDAGLVLMQSAYRFLKRASKGGRVVIIASKNVRAPGPGVAAYSASKAALTQLARVAALEWGADGIRVNVVHPNAVFDTGLWSEAVIRERASRYGQTPAEYRRSNALHVEVESQDVADVVVALCGDTFDKTTGAQIPVDGGNDRVI